MEAAGNPVTLLGRPAEVLGVADSVKPEAAKTVAALQRRRIQVWMLSGDNRATAQAMATAHIDIGIAIGSASAMAKEADDIPLLRDNALTVGDRQILAAGPLLQGLTTAQGG